MERELIREEIIKNGKTVQSINLEYNKNPTERSLTGYINDKPVYVRLPLIQQLKKQIKKQVKTQNKRKAALNAKRKAKRDSIRKTNRKSAKSSPL